MENVDENIVKQLVKVDFHIHSAASIKDKDKVKFNTIENIDLLVDNLIKNQIGMAAISDHNTFSLEMYEKFKSYEGTKLRKVLPAVGI